MNFLPLATLVCSKPSQHVIVDYDGSHSSEHRRCDDQPSAIQDQFSQPVVQSTSTVAFLVQTDTDEIRGWENINVWALMPPEF